MSITQIFVILFAIVCATVSAVAIYRVWKSPRIQNKLLWTVGCLLGFVGFSVDPETQGDLILQFGLQIPVVIFNWGSAKGLALKALFPILAIVALVRATAAETRPAE